MELRNTTAETLPDLTSLWKEFMDHHAATNSFFTRTPDGHDHWMAWLREQLAGGNFVVIVAEEAGVPIGYCIATTNDNPPVFALKRYGYIQDMAVTAEWRRRGVARQLFEAAREWLAGRGVDRVHLSVGAHNPVSRVFWKEMGFKPHAETWARPL